MSTTAQQLRDFANRGNPIELPVSKIEVQFKRVNLRDLVVRGHLPATLFQKALAGFPEITSDKDVDPTRLMEIVEELTDYQRTVLMAGLVSPRMVEENPADDEIVFEDLVEEDREFLMNIAQMSVKEWEPFLREQRARLSTLDNREEPTGASE